DKELVAEALKTVCTISLPERAYKQLLADPEVAAVKEWVPANFAGPNGAKVFARRSDKTLRVGVSGAFTYAGFHDAVLDRVEDVAAQAALDRAVFAGGCSENSETSVSALSEDILKLYYDDYIAQWDSFLRDMRLAPLNDLNVASENLKDLSSADSALKRLLTAVVQETDLTRSDEAPADDKGGAAKTGSKLLSKLGKLGNVLQTVTANPNPQDAIKKQGGLAELTGAVARQAQILPSPINDWLGGIAGDTSGLSQKAVTNELNAIWRADILPFCQAALNNRYPFSPESAVDVNVRDFQRLFGPAGLIDAFINDHLINYVDTASEPWKWRADFGLDPAALPAFEQARHIRDDLFPGGTGPVMNFTLEPKDLSPNVARVTLNLDGQNLVYYNNATRPQPMTWPGKDGTGVISLAFQPVDGSPEVMLNETGSWAWLRMLRGGKFNGTKLTDVYSLRLGTKGMYADFELKAASVENPYTLEMFKKFTCPPQI
ncbi:MAG: type VI secretion system membrane subunit TssM, partial [Mesorhizobium sp.]